MREHPPSSERPGFLAHQVVLAGVGALQPVNEDLGGFEIVVAELEHADLGRA